MVCVRTKSSFVAQVLLGDQVVYREMNENLMMEGDNLGINANTPSRGSTTGIKSGTSV